MSTVLAAELSFDWDAYRSSYGHGGECLREIELALRSASPYDCHEVLEGTLRFVHFDGLLTEAAPAYAATLVVKLRARPSWSILAVLGVLVRATWTTLVPGHWPLPRTASDHGLTSPATRLNRQDEQQVLARRVRQVICAARDIVVSTAWAQSENERLHAWALLAWATGGFTDPSQRLPLPTSETDGVELGALLFEVPGHAHSTSFPLFADACRGADEASLDAVLELVADERHREFALEGLSEFPWYDGSRSAAAVALVARSPRSAVAKRHFFERALEFEPTIHPDSLLPPPPTGATLAAWYLLAHHVRVIDSPQPTLGPEDLDNIAAGVLQRLVSRRATWMIFASQWLPYFGIPDLQYARDLVSHELPILRESVTDVWAGSLTTRSVWKWIHRVEADTPPGSPERSAATRVCASVLKAHLNPENMVTLARFCLDRPTLRDLGQNLLHGREP